MSDDELHQVRLRSRRGAQAAPDSAQFQEWSVEVMPDETVLDALELVRLEHDETLMYRQGCHHGSCGTCGCRIDGVERLACVTRIDELESDSITVEPLDGFPHLGDLVVDIRPLYRQLESDWSLTRESEGAKKKPLAAGLDGLRRLEDCIECGCCISACPIAGDQRPFVGPAALAALNRQRLNQPEEATRWLTRAAEPTGENLCQRAIDCSRRCPTGVSPARHIAELRRLVNDD